MFKSFPVLKKLTANITQQNFNGFNVLKRRLLWYTNLLFIFVSISGLISNVSSYITKPFILDSLQMALVVALIGSIIVVYLYKKGYEKMIELVFLSYMTIAILGVIPAYKSQGRIEFIFPVILIIIFLFNVYLELKWIIPASIAIFGIFAMVLLPMTKNPFVIIDYTTVFVILVGLNYLLRSASEQGFKEQQKLIENQTDLRAKTEIAAYKAIQDKEVAIKEADQDAHRIKTPIQGVERQMTAMLRRLALLAQSAGTMDLRSAEGMNFAKELMDIKGVVVQIKNAAETMQENSSNPHLNSHMMRMDIAETRRFIETVFGEGARFKGIILQIDCPTFWVEINSVSYLDMISNYVSNAIKYTQEGGKVDIVIKVLPDSSTLRVKVEDNGPGIPEDKRDLLFTHRETLGVSSGGTGVGLGGVKDAVEKLGGRVWYEPQKGRGSIFFYEITIKHI